MGGGAPLAFLNKKTWHPGTLFKLIQIKQACCIALVSDYRHALLPVVLHTSSTCFTARLASPSAAYACHSGCMLLPYFKSWCLLNMFFSNSFLQAEPCDAHMQGACKTWRRYGSESSRRKQSSGSLRSCASSMKMRGRMQSSLRWLRRLATSEKIDHVLVAALTRRWLSYLPLQWLHASCQLHVASTLLLI